MLSITKYDENNNYRTLENDPLIFHEALENVLRGEKRFHVQNGDNSFDLTYEDNDSLSKADPYFPDSDFYFSEIFFPPYYRYDENDLSRINLELLDGFDEIFFEEVNEYSIIIASMAIRHKNMQVTFKDESIRLFSWIADKVEVSPKPQKEKTIYVQKNFYPIYTTSDRYCTIGLFHCLFLLQWISDLSTDQLKYLSLSIRKTEGIGSIMSTCNVVSQAFKKYGMKVFIESGCTRFSSELLSSYFVFGEVPEDSNRSNTAYAKCFNSFVLNHFVQQYDPVIGLDILQPKFLSQMKEYADQIIGDRKVLGVLLRGTDYMIANFAGSYHPASIEDCIRIIDERVREYDYDRIFVATEDSYFLERMIAAFPQKVLAISQERHNVSEFRDLRYISELERRLYEGDSYYASVEDTTVNYFYAIYLLSRCESLISNCMCSGVRIASAFNQGKYERTEIVSDMLSQRSQ